MTHRTDVERYAGTLAELAADLGDLRYDALEGFLDSLAAKLAADAAADEGRGRRRLAEALGRSAARVRDASEAVREAWRISGPRMGGVSGAMPILKLVLQWLLGLLFIAAGATHFRVPDFYVRIMPPYLPWHRELVYLSGACEILLGGLLLVPRCAPYAAWGMIALLVAVFPANLYMAIHPELYPKLSPVVLWVRLPLQGVLIAWAYWFTGETPRA